MKIDEFLARMPKVELHLHMEGAIPPDLLFALAERNRINLPFVSPEQLATRLSYGTFKDFVNMILMFANCMRQPRDFADVVYRIGTGMSRQNIRYAEITWTPQMYLGLDISLQDILEALNDGRRRALSEMGTEICWIPDLVRCFPETAEEIVDWLCSDAARDRGIVALGLGGPEDGYPAAPFAAAFDRARAAGLASNPHAGENAGPASVREAVQLLQARRIGHGVRAVEDPRLLDTLAERGIALEVCPTSNVRLGVCPSYADHPLRRLVDAGCTVTINSDDPVLFGTTLTDEYRHAVVDCGLTIAEVEQTVLNAVTASYLSAEEKQAMRQSFLAEFARLKGEGGGPGRHPSTTPGKGTL